MEEFRRIVIWALSLGGRGSHRAAWRLDIVRILRLGRSRALPKRRRAISHTWGRKFSDFQLQELQRNKTMFPLEHFSSSRSARSAVIAFHREFSKRLKSRVASCIRDVASIAMPH